MEQLNLGTEKIGKLLKKFAIPCIISMVVNALYNIVDQIFIGWGVDYLGNGATNIVFPITVICLSFALMFGDGTSAYLSLKLGEKKQKEAERGVGSGIATGSIISIILCVIVLIFLPQLLNLFGCTDALREYALKYGGVIAIGIPFMMIGTILSSVIRADGSPKYSMFSMVAGAILNIILDPIFIFDWGLNMGIQGAALATILSQFITFGLNVAYIKRFKTIKLTKETFRPDFKIASTVAKFGISSFITQMAIVVVITVQNTIFKQYGELSRFGADIPITVLGIVMKINQILSSIIIGIAAGSQPILGYNYGARKYDRVKKTLKIVLGSSVIISTIAFILFQTIPDKLILIFGSGDENYMEFACLAFRTYLLLCIFNGVQIPSGIFFQAIGKSTKSAILSLSRQIVILIPAMIILSHAYGIIGVLSAGPVADGLAFILAVILLVKETRSLKENSAEVEKPANIKIIEEKNTNTPIVITIAREYGSGGRYIGKLVAEKLGIKLYDKEFIEKMAEDTGLSEEYIRENEQKRNALDVFNNGYYAGLNNADELFIKESKLIKKVADEESCIIVGRCADYILRSRPDVLRVFVYADRDIRLRRAIDEYGDLEEHIDEFMHQTDKRRRIYYENYTNQRWGDRENYDLMLNSGDLGIEKCVELICQAVK